MSGDAPPSSFDGQLLKDELFWRDHAAWLKERGYQLRPRYQPDWKPSWVGKKSRSRFEFEDGNKAKETDHLMDALRLSDGVMVMMKKLKASNSQELEMNQRFYSGLLPVDDLHNHCVPIYEILRLPDDENVYLIVMPFLRPWWPTLYNIPFSTVGEGVAFVRQIFEGVQLFHRNHIAHNDIKFDNVMVDATPLYRRPLHPTVRDRTYDWKKAGSPRSMTRHPVKYYFIDFDLCRQYDPQAGQARENPGYGGDKSVPEFAAHPDQPCDPFAVDVYRLGNLIRRFLMTTQRTDEDLRRAQTNPSLNFMADLITDMTQDDPTKRPTIDVVVSRFDEIVNGLNSSQLRSAFWPGFQNPWENTLVRVLWNTPRRFVSRMINLLGRYPAIPPTPGPPKGGRKSR